MCALSPYQLITAIITSKKMVKLRERDYLKDSGVNGKIIFKRIFEKWFKGHGLDQSGSGQEHVKSYCECGNEHSGSITCGTFPD
jgi:hypothetical protein